MSSSSLDEYFPLTAVPTARISPVSGSMLTDFLCFRVKRRFLKTTGRLSENILCEIRSLRNSHLCPNLFETEQ